MAEHLTIPGALEWDAVERHSIATLRYAGGKEHDVKYVSEVAYDALAAQLKALGEDLSMFVKAQLGISISEPGESFVQTTLRLFRMSKRRAAEFGIPEGENLEADIEVFEDYDALQQRLTVAEQRSNKLEGLLREAATTCRVNDLIISANYFESALKP